MGAWTQDKNNYSIRSFMGILVNELFNKIKTGGKIRFLERLTSVLNKCTELHDL